jgi:hypothetical protein
VSDAIVSWDTAGGQTQPREVALGPLLDYAYTGHGACAAALLGDQWNGWAQGRSAVFG